MNGTAIALSALLSFAPVTAAVPDPGKHGFSETGLAKLRDSFNRMIADGEIAGMVGLVARDGHIVWHEALGMKDREKKEPMRLDTIFYIASLTKIVTSAAAMILVEEGKLELDDPVSKHLPNIGNMKVRERNGDDEFRQEFEKLVHEAFVER